MAVKYYTVTLVDDSSINNVDPSDLYCANDVQFAEKLSASLGFFRPDWLKQGQKVLLLHNNVCKQGYLNINKDNIWGFVSQDTNERITFTHSLSNIQYS